VTAGARDWHSLVYQGPSSQRLCGQVKALGVTSTEQARALLDDPERRQTVLVAQHGFRQPDFDALRKLVETIERKQGTGPAADFDKLVHTDPNGRLHGLVKHFDVASIEQARAALADAKRCENAIAHGFYHWDLDALRAFLEVAEKNGRDQRL
jgi:hypothetical protein